MQMCNRLQKLIKQLSLYEQQALYEKIKRDYAVEEHTSRDDIFAKVAKSINMQLRKKVEIKEGMKLYYDLRIGIVEEVTLLENIAKAFELECIPYLTTMSWVTVGDVVDSMENMLEHGPYKEEE